MREFTEEEKQWLIENYPVKKQKDCARYLHCSDGVIRRLAKELGLYEYRKTYDKNPIKKAKQGGLMEINQESQGYCLDCSLYRVGGICGNNGRETGALHKKNCFKEREYENTNNNSHQELA